MEGSARDDIRSLLKEFGIQADEAIVTHLACHQGVEKLQLRITLEDRTEYGESISVTPLMFMVEGVISRSDTN